MLKGRDQDILLFGLFFIALSMTFPAASWSEIVESAAVWL